MKKIIGILGITVIAMAMFFNTNAVNNSNGDLNLASLLNINTANAEVGCEGGSCSYTTYFAGKPNTVCTACCPSGKTPKCDAFGCTCT